MDEPFGALDAQNRNLLQDELLQMWDQTAAEKIDGGNGKSEADRRERKTILFVTHSIDEAIVLGGSRVGHDLRAGPHQSRDPRALCTGRGAPTNSSATLSSAS